MRTTLYLEQITVIVNAVGPRWAVYNDHSVITSTVCKVPILPDSLLNPFCSSFSTNSDITITCIEDIITDKSITHHLYNEPGIVIHAIKHPRYIEIHRLLIFHGYFTGSLSSCCSASALIDTLYT